MTKSNSASGRLLLRSQVKAVYVDCGQKARTVDVRPSILDVACTLVAHEALESRKLLDDAAFARSPRDLEMTSAVDEDRNKLACRIGLGRVPRRLRWRGIHASVSIGVVALRLEQESSSGVQNAAFVSVPCSSFVGMPRIEILLSLIFAHAGDKRRLNHGDGLWSEARAGRSGGSLLYVCCSSSSVSSKAVLFLFSLSLSVSHSSTCSARNTTPCAGQQAVPRPKTRLVSKKGTLLLEGEVKVFLQRIERESRVVFSSFRPP